MALPFLNHRVCGIERLLMKTPIGFLTVGSFIKKGGNLMNVFAIDSSEVLAVDRAGNFVAFDTQVLDLQDVKAA
jgi:phosphosulfolactate synthase (CoM biosynthesis protein A)